MLCVGVASCVPRASALSIGGLEQKYEMPEVGKCLCLFDVDRTLTSRPPEPSKRL